MFIPTTQLTNHFSVSYKFSRSRQIIFSVNYNFSISFKRYRQGSPHLQKIGRLDFSLREHEGEVKAWQGDFQKRHVFAKMWVFSLFFFFCIWCVSLLRSCLYLSYLTLNSCFVFVLLLLLILYLLILDLFIFALKSVNDI